MRTNLVSLVQPRFWIRSSLPCSEACQFMSLVRSRAFLLLARSSNLFREARQGFNLPALFGRLLAYTDGPCLDSRVPFGLVKRPLPLADLATDQSRRGNGFLIPWTPPQPRTSPCLGLNGSHAVIELQQNDQCVHCFCLWHASARQPPAHRYRLVRQARMKGCSSEACSFVTFFLARQTLVLVSALLDPD